MTTDDKMRTSFCTRCHWIITYPDDKPCPECGTMDHHGAPENVDLTLRTHCFDAGHADTCKRHGEQPFSDPNANGDSYCAECLKANVLIHAQRLKKPLVYLVVFTHTDGKSYSYAIQSPEPPRGKGVPAPGDYDVDVLDWPEQPWAWLIDSYYRGAHPLGDDDVVKMRVVGYVPPMYLPDPASETTYFFKPKYPLRLIKLSVDNVPIGELSHFKPGNKKYPPVFKLRALGVPPEFVDPQKLNLN